MEIGRLLFFCTSHGAKWRLAGCWDAADGTVRCLGRAAKIEEGHIVEIVEHWAGLKGPPHGSKPQSANRSSMCIRLYGKRG